MTAVEAMDAAEKLLYDARLWVRKSAKSFDDEIIQTTAACFLDLQNAGITVFSPDDPLLRQAAKLYLKAHFGYDAESDKWERAYEHLKAALSLSSDYAKGNSDG